MIFYTRLLNLSQIKDSLFLFGPRFTGKTTLLRAVASDAYFDLLDPELELQYRSRPGLFWEQIKILPPGSTIVIDEIQKIPELLNYVQMAIDRYKHICLISGSSARKLKRGGANLLGGRALDLKLHPLTCKELKEAFTLDNAMRYGTLPKIYSLLDAKKRDMALKYLKSYITTYIKEEIQAEALTRNVGAFHRFLAIAAQSNGQVIEFANISKECSVPASTVKEYYQILEDTLIGFFLWPHDRNERKKARPKFYFFDCGVVRTIQNRLQDPPTPQEKGFLFETWLLGELRRLRDYLGKNHEFSFWRSRKNEIDIIISNGQGPVLAIECKSGSNNIKQTTISAFRKKFPEVRLVVASANETVARRSGNVDVLPWQQILDLYEKEGPNLYF